MLKKGKTEMKNALATLLLMAITASAQTAPPPISYTIEADYQQTQSLPNQSFQQGAGVRLRYKLKSNGSYLSLAGLTGKWQGRESATSTNYITQTTATTVTNTTPNYFQFDLDYTATGTAVTNWVYSMITTYSGSDYVMGEGRLDIKSSSWTGAGATITADSCVNRIIAGSNITISPTNGMGDVTISASGGGTNTLAEVLTAGNVSDGYDILLSAAGLDQSRRLGFVVNSGIPPMTTNYLDSITNGVLRFNGDAIAVQDWVTGLGYGDFLADGTVPMTGNLNMGGRSITNVGDLLSSSAADFELYMTGSDGSMQISGSANRNTTGYLQIYGAGFLQGEVEIGFAKELNVVRGATPLALWDDSGLQLLGSRPTINGTNLLMSGDVATSTLAEVLAAGNVAGTNINMGFSQILNLGTPTVAGSAATKSYVDSATNNAIIDATNRVAGVGYITAPPANDTTTTNIAQNITAQAITTTNTITAEQITSTDDFLVSAVGGKYAFGDGDTYIYESADDTLNIVAPGGNPSIAFSLFAMSSSISGGFYINKYAGSASSPAYTFNNDGNTGYGVAGADLAAISAGGAYRFYVGTTAITSTVPITATAFKFPAGDYLTGDGTNLFYVTADLSTTNALTSN